MRCIKLKYNLLFSPIYEQDIITEFCFDFDISVKQSNLSREYCF